MRLLPGLNRERLIEELLVEILLDVMDKNECFTLVIKLRPTRTPHHLQNIYTHRAHRVHYKRPWFQFCPSIPNKMNSPKPICNISFSFISSQIMLSIKKPYIKAIKLNTSVMIAKSGAIPICFTKKR